MESEADSNSMNILPVQSSYTESRGDAESKYSQLTVQDPCTSREISDSFDDVGMVTPAERIQKVVATPNNSWQTPSRNIKLLKNKLPLRSPFITPDMGMCVVNENAENFVKRERSSIQLAKKKRLLFPESCPHVNSNKLNASATSDVCKNISLNSSQSLAMRELRNAIVETFPREKGESDSNLCSQKVRNQNNNVVDASLDVVHDQLQDNHTSLTRSHANCNTFMSERLEKVADEEIVREPSCSKTHFFTEMNLKEAESPFRSRVKERLSRECLGQEQNICRLSPGLHPRKIPKLESAILENKFTQTQFVEKITVEDKIFRESSLRGSVYDINHNVIPSSCLQSHENWVKRGNTAGSCHRKKKTATPSRTVEKRSYWVGKENVPEYSKNASCSNRRSGKRLIGSNGSTVASPLPSIPSISCWAPKKKKRPRFSSGLFPSCRRSLLRPFEEASLERPMLETPPCSPNRYNLLPLW